MTDQVTVKIDEIEIARDLPFALIAGPCQLESRGHAMMMAERVLEAASGADVPVIFKSSYDKANRSSITTRRGVGIEAGLEILAVQPIGFQ